MTIGAWRAWRFLAQVDRLDRYRVGMGVAGEKCGVAGDTLSAQCFIGGAAGQRTIDKAMAALAAIIGMDLASIDKRCVCGSMTVRTVCSGRGGG